jgi:PAS domain S-box-containing protein
VPKLATAIPPTAYCAYWIQLTAASAAIGLLSWLVLQQLEVSGYWLVTQGTASSISMLGGAAVAILFFFHGSRSFVQREHAQALRTAHALINKIAATIVIINERGFIEGASDNLPTIFGYDNSEIIGKKLALLVPELENAVLADFITLGLKAENQHTQTPVVHVRRRAGDMGAFAYTIAEIHVGKRQMFSVCLRDASYQQHTHQHIAYLEKRIDVLEEAVHLRNQVLKASMSGIGLVSVLPDGPRITHINPAFERITGFPAKMVVGADPQSFFNVSTLIDSAQRELAAAPGQSFNREFSMQRRDGTTIEIDLHIVPIMRENNTPAHFVAMFNDITEKKRSAEEAAQTERLQSLGQLTSNVAHDFNNFLAIIKGNLEMLQAALPADSHERTLSDRAMRGCGLAADLVQLLAAFARRQHLRPVLSDVVALMHQLRTMIPGFLDHDVGISLRCAEPTAMIMVDQSQLQSCILNLAINSRDAMPDGGDVILEVAREPTLPQGAIVVSPHVASSYIRISVIDQGTGMPEHVRQRALEPFFTTKPVGKGTGLGLSTVFGFVQQSGGAMLIESAEHAGTTVSLFFPEIQPS